MPTPDSGRFGRAGFLAAKLKPHGTDYRFALH